MLNALKIQVWKKKGEVKRKKMRARIDFGRHRIIVRNFNTPL